MKKPNWDEYFMGEAVYVLRRSPDPATKHGAIIVNEDHIPQGQGYNGFPAGGTHPYPTTRPEKYAFIVHAERNAILNCPFRPKGCTLYVTGLPCSSCMKDIIQSGIKRVVYGKIGSAMVDEDEFNRTFMMATNHFVSLEEFNGPSPVEGFLEVIEYLKSKGWV